MQHHRPASKQNRIAALADHRAPAERELIVSLKRDRPGRGGDNQPQHAALLGLVNAPPQGLLDLGGVARLDNDTVWKRTEKRNVPQALVGFTRAGRNQSRKVTDVNDLGLFRGVGVNLFVGPRGQKHAEGADDGQKPLKRQPPGGGHHVLLGDSVFDEALGKGILKVPQAAVGGKIGIQHHDVFSFGSQLHQCFPKHVYHFFGYVLEPLAILLPGFDDFRYHRPRVPP